MQSSGWALLWHSLYLRLFLAQGNFCDFSARPKNCVQHVQRVCKSELQHPDSLMLWLPFLTVLLCLTSSFLPSLSFLSVPARMALSLSMCLRLTITPIPLKGGQALANRWRACSVLVSWLSLPVLCPLPTAHCWVPAQWPLLSGHFFVCVKLALLFSYRNRQIHWCHIPASSGLFYYSYVLANVLSKSRDIWNSLKKFKKKI